MRMSATPWPEGVPLLRVGVEWSARCGASGTGWVVAAARGAGRGAGGQAGRQGGVPLSRVQDGVQVGAKWGVQVGAKWGVQVGTQWALGVTNS